jgi:hypothetical protein
VRFDRAVTTQVVASQPGAVGKSLLRKILRHAVAGGYMAPRPN